MNELTVVKSNDLIDASYRLTLNEQRLVLMCIGEIKRSQLVTDHSKFRVSAAAFAEAFSLPLKTAYKELQQVAEKLYERSINIKNPFPDDPKITHIKTRWVSSITYLTGNGEIILCFAQDVIPYISMLEGRFTRYSLHAITGMKSTYGMRFYELIRKWMSASYELQYTKEISLDDLKERLELTDKYKAIKDFKLKVLEPAMKDINTYSDIKARYTQQKTGRRVSHLIFYFKPNDQLKLQLPTGPAKKITKAYIEKNAYPGETYEQAKTRLSKNS